MTPRSSAVAALLALSAALSGCGEEDAASIKITLNENFSGTIAASSVAIPSAGAPPAVEGATQGVTWNARGQIVMTTGSFSELAKLTVADITFEYDKAAPMMVRVVVPRGPAARWPALLTVTDKKLRDQTVAALAPDVKNSAIGSVATIVIKLPPGTRAVTSGVKGLGRGLNATMESTSVMLTVPIEVAMGAGQPEPATITSEPLSWHFTWEKDDAKKK